MHLPFHLHLLKLHLVLLDILFYQVAERPIPIEELLDADEVFCTGTAVGVAPVGSIAFKGNM